MIAVVGDRFIDIDEHLDLCRMSDDWQFPICKNAGLPVQRLGGAAAVAECIKAFGNNAALFPTNEKIPGLKLRYFVNKKCVLRKDYDDTKAITDSQADEITESVIGLQPSLIVVSDYDKGAVTQRVFDSLVSTGIKLIADPARNKSLDFYANAWAIIPSRSRYGFPVDFSVARRECLKIFDATNANCVCLKMDAAGLFCAERNGRMECIESTATLVEDTVGCGDVAIAAIASAIADGAGWIDACHFGNAMAGIKCGQMGQIRVDGHSWGSFKLAQAGQKS